jgi:hypothetical protein
MLVSAAALVTAIGVVVALALSGPQPPRGAVPHARGSPAAAATPRGPGSASVQLVAQDLTPDSQLGLKGSGFVDGEQLAVTIEDAQGNPYTQATLTADKDGRLLDTPLALPPQLGPGEYQVRVVGSTSHRAVSAVFRMHTVPPTVVLGTYAAKPGQDVGFSGSGFIAGELVHVRLGTAPAPLASARATDLGGVTGHLRIPALPAGTYSLTLVGESSRTPVSVGFNVQVFAPWVVLSRYYPAPGEGVGIIGQGFGPGEQVLMYLNSTRGKPALTVTADVDGRFVVQDTWVPSGASGRNELIFVGQSSRATSTAEFIVQPAAQPTSAPTAPWQPTSAPTPPTAP